jgi:hypothetical protein
MGSFVIILWDTGGGSASGGDAEPVGLFVVDFLSL